MGTGPKLKLCMQTRALEMNQGGHREWVARTRAEEVDPTKTLLILCDMWDWHKCRGAVVRLGPLAKRANEVVKSARSRGVHIIHAPSDTMKFYADSPARKRMLELPEVKPPTDLQHDDPPLPIDDSDGGCDTEWSPENKPRHSQHPAIEIDQTRDGITEKGQEVFNYVRAHGIEQVVLCGVHTNMCILKRTFGIKQMVKWDIPIVLVRDITDSMYNPAKSPYVSHDEGTRLVVEFIEKFWCPTILSTDLEAGG